MECLRRYLNELSKNAGEEYARKCGTTRGYLRKAINKKQELGTELSVMLENESDGEVTRKGLHPNNWMKKWPELATKDK